MFCFGRLSWLLAPTHPSHPTPTRTAQLALEMKDEAIEALRGYEARCRRVPRPRSWRRALPLARRIALAPWLRTRSRHSPCSAALWPLRPPNPHSPTPHHPSYPLPSSRREAEGELATRDAQLAALEARLREQAEAAAEAAAAAEEEAAAALADAKERVQHAVAAAVAEKDAQLHAAQERLRQQLQAQLQQAEAELEVRAGRLGGAAPPACHGTRCFSTALGASLPADFPPARPSDPAPPPQPRRPPWRRLWSARTLSWRTCGASWSRRRRRRRCGASACGWGGGWRAEGPGNGAVVLAVPLHFALPSNQR